MKKKLVSLCIVLVLVALMTASLVACDDGEKEFRVGLICLHDNSSTYDKNFIDSMDRAIAQLGLKKTQLELVTSVPETAECETKARELAATCDIVFANSFGHEDFMINAAKDNPDVWFCHSTGTKAHTEELANYYNAFASIYEGRYLAGIAAGMKLNEMISAGTITADKAVMGYVGAFSYAEVVSGYTSFYLGAKSVCPSVTMKVRYTGSWYDFDKEKEAANALITTDNCVLISQHADSYGAPEACEAAGVPNVTYNGTTESRCPNTYVVSSKIDWTPYYVEMIKAKMDGKTVAEKDYTGTLSTGSVKLDAVGKTCAVAGTQDAIDAAMAKLKDGSLKVFDVSTFTVSKANDANPNATIDANGRLTKYMADVDTDKAFTGDTDVVKTENGITYFAESEFRSAPYFDLRIVGIEELNQAF